MISINKKTKLQIILIIFIISSGIVIPSIPKSYAHAFVEKSDPSPSQSLSTAPTRVDVYFSDPVDIRYSQLKILDSDGKEIDSNDQHYINGDESTLSVSLPSGLKNGIYTVSTKVLDQTDGHVTENAFVFAVGEVIPANLANPVTSSNYQEVSIPEAIARFPALLGQIIVTGAMSATLWLWNPISRISSLKNSVLQTRIKIDHLMIKLAVIGSVIILSSGFAMIIVQAFSINAGILDALSTKYGNMLLLRMVASAYLLALSLATYYKLKKSPQILSRSKILTMLGASFVVLLTTSLISHGAATGKLIPLLLDFFHNVFASLWIGGIIYIAFVVMPQIKEVANRKIGLSIISLFIPRFSMLVITILGAVVITGPFLLYVLEGNLGLTLASFYGKILIIKLLLACAMISLGAYDHMVIHKDAHSTISRSENRGTIQNIETNANQILNKFHKSIMIEAFVGIALIASVAVLVDSGLPSSEFQNQLQTLQTKVFALAISNVPQNNQTYSETRFIENGSRIVLSMTPFSTGNNDFKISFLDSARNPIDMKSVQLKLTQTDSGIGPITINANRTSPGIFSANTDFGFSGHWTVRIEGVQNKENALNLIASYNLIVKPKLSDLNVNIQEFKTPENNIMPLYPLYDSIRNKIWTGDTNTTTKSGTILELDPQTGKYTAHRIDGTSIITFMALDSHDTIWYVDPLTKILGHYNPNDNSNQKYPIPSQGILSSILVDKSNTLWLAVASTSEILKFDSNTTRFSSIKLAYNSEPLGMTTDVSSNAIWIAEGTGKLASLNPDNNTVTEYVPRQADYTLSNPTSLILDPETGWVYISEHEGHAVSVFNPLFKTFKRIQLDRDGLPFGMAFDKYHNLWVAQHTLDKISIIDTRTGEAIEKNIPSSGSFVQWITSDSQGNIIIAEQRAHALGIVSISANPSSQISQANTIVGIPSLPVNYVQVAAPSITGLLVVVAFFYCKGVIDLRRTVEQVEKMQ